MKFTSIAAGLGLVVAAVAAPVEERDVQTVHLTFHGGPASYDIALPADGNIYPTSMFCHGIFLPDRNSLTSN
jgi:hypothetical protein